MIVKVPPWTSSGSRRFPRALREVGDRGRHPLEAQPLGLADHRHDQAVVEGDRDPEVDVLVVDDLVFADRGVQQRVSLQRLDRRERDERQIGEVDAAPAHRLALGAPPATTREKSTSTIVVQWAAVRRLSVMCRAIAWRIGDIGSARVGPNSSSTVGGGAPADAAGTASPPASLGCGASTSSGR